MFDRVLLTKEDQKDLVAGIRARPKKSSLAFVAIALAMGKDLQNDFVCADLREYPLSGQNLSGVNLEGADLRNADLRQAKGYKQRGVLLSGAKISARRSYGKDSEENWISHLQTMNLYGKNSEIVSKFSQNAQKIETMSQENRSHLYYYYIQSLSDGTNFADAISELGRVVWTGVNLFGNKDHRVLAIRNNRARVLCEFGRFEEALSEFEDILRIESDNYGSTDSVTIVTRSNRAWALSELGRHSEALSELDAVLEIESEKFGIDAPDTLVTRSKRAGTLSKIGHHSEAVSEFNAVLAVRNIPADVIDVDTLSVISNRAPALIGVNRLGEAESDLRMCIAGFEALNPPLRHCAAIARIRLARLLADLGHSGEALELACQAVVALEPEHRMLEAARQLVTSLTA